MTKPFRPGEQARTVYGGSLVTVKRVAPHRPDEEPRYVVAYANGDEKKFIQSELSRELDTRNGSAT